MFRRFSAMYGGWKPGYFYVSPCVGFALAIAVVVGFNHLRPGPALTASPIVLLGFWAPTVYAAISQIFSGHEVEESPTGYDITDRQVRMYEVRLMAPGVVLMFGGLLTALLPVRWFLPGITVVVIVYAALAAAHWHLAYRQFMQDILRGRGRVSRYTNAIDVAARCEKLTMCELVGAEASLAHVRAGWALYLLVAPISVLAVRLNDAVVAAAPPLIQGTIFVIVCALPGSVALLAAMYHARFVRFGIDRGWNVPLAYQGYSVAAVVALAELGVVLEKLGSAWLPVTVAATVVITGGVYRANTAAAARADISWWFPLSVGWHRQRQRYERAATSAELR